MGLIGLYINPKHIGQVGISFFKATTLGLIEPKNYIINEIQLKFEE
jgi:uncharacterized protein YlzI (FlbEa/FlbD family)